MMSPHMTLRIGLLLNKVYNFFSLIELLLPVTVK